jgi:hypothetical protein
MDAQQLAAAAAATAAPPPVAAAAAGPPTAAAATGGPSKRGRKGGRKATAAEPEELVKLGPEILKTSERLRTGWHPVQLSAEDRADSIALDDAQLAASSSGGYRMVGTACPMLRWRLIWRDLQGGRAAWACCACPWRGCGGLAAALPACQQQPADPC